MDYLLPTATEVPDDRVRAHRDAEPRPGGYKGVGEGGAIGAPPAVVNAVADALSPFGVTVTRLPLTPVARSWRSSTHDRQPTRVTDDQHDRRLLRPVRRRDQRRSVPGVPPAARGGAALLQRAVRLLRASAATTTSSAGCVDRETYISGRGGILELIKANIEMPPGVLIFEDPPMHTIHRGLLSRVFTPKKMNALEPKIREFCAASLDPLVGAGRFDFVADLGAQMPMRVIGMLLGIPEQDQEAIRDHADAIAAHRGRQADEGLAGRRPAAARCSPTTSTGAPSTRPTTS